MTAGRIAHGILPLFALALTLSCGDSDRKPQLTDRPASTSGHPLASAPEETNLSNVGSAPTDSGAGETDARKLDGEVTGPQFARAVTNELWLDAALELIRGSKQEIEIAHFMFVYGEAVGQVQEELARAVRRGVRVSMILDEEVEKTHRSISHLKERGIDVRLDSPRKRTHAKMILVDRAHALFGSTNFSDASILKTNETNILLSDSALCGALHDYFIALRDHPDEDADIPPVSAHGVTLLFDRDFESAFFNLIETADTIDLQIYASNYKERDPQSPPTRAVDGVVNRSRSGAAVRVIMEQSDYNEDLNRLNAEAVRIFNRGGVRVRRDPLHVTSHAKMVLTDKGILIGSTNWGYGSFRQYHELNVLIVNPEVTASFRKYYEELWKSSR